MADVAALFDRVPLGWSVVHYAGHRYGVVKSASVGGRCLKIFAEELGGSDVVSANLYLTGESEQFRPCEMPAGKVTDFLGGLKVLDEVPMPDKLHDPAP